MDYLLYNALFNSISVISGRWMGDNGRLCSLEPRLPFNKYMNGLRFYALFNSMSVISRRSVGDNERLYAMELRL